MKTIRIPGPKRDLLVVIACAFLGVAFAPGRGLAQSEIVVYGPARSGTLNWTAPPYLSAFTVQWAPTVMGPWTNSWAPLTDIPNTNEICAAQLPVFYRVLGSPYPGALLHGDGTNDSAVILDAQGHAVSVYGDARIYTTNSYFGSGSIYFDGTGDYLSLGAHNDWAFGTGDFTVDLWANFHKATGTISLIGPHTSGLFTDWSLVYQGTALNFYVNGTVAAGHIWTPTLGQWYHLAVTRSAGIIYMFVDGQLVKTAANANNISNTRALTIGAAVNPTLFYSGFMDEVHLLKGRALWTQDFTPPVEPYGY